jgi:polysaccharide biosynthesis protein PslH
MKVLFLTIKLPHEEVVGGNRIVHQRIRYLAETGCQVGLISFIRDEEKRYVDSLRPLLTELHTVALPQRNIFQRAFHDYPSMTRPALFWKLFSNEMMRTVGDVAEKGRYDAVISEFSEMGQYLYRNRYLSAVHKIMSCHRCVTASYEKYKDFEEVRWRLHLKSIPQLHGLQKYEFNMYRSADRVMVLTSQDRFTMQYYAPDLAVSVVPSGVDIDYLQAHPPMEKEPIILMTGFMGDPANEDGAEWFAHHVWPQIKVNHPEVKFYIVGSSPSRRVARLAGKDPRIIVTGAVKDIRPYRNRARVFVSPVRLGSGIRTKVLEAMAGGLPVVSTSLGMAGIEAQTGVNCLVADTPELFTQSVDWLLTDERLVEKMVKNGRDLVEKKHDLESGLQLFKKTVQSVIEG